jgi:hypothetical protein
MFISSEFCRKNKNSLSHVHWRDVSVCFCLLTRWLQHLDVDVANDEVDFPDESDDMTMLDNFVSYLNRKLIWVPKLNDNCSFAEDSKDVYFGAGFFEKDLSLEFALRQLEHLLLSDFGRIPLFSKEVVPIQRYCPHLGDSVTFQTASTTLWMAWRDRKHGNIAVTDPFALVTLVPKSDRASFGDYSMVRRADPVDIFSPLGALRRQQCRQAWAEVQDGVTVYVRLAASVERCRLHRTLFTSLLLTDLVYLAELHRSRLVIRGLLKDYSNLDASVFVVLSLVPSHHSDSQASVLFDAQRLIYEQETLVSSFNDDIDAVADDMASAMAVVTPSPVLVTASEPAQQPPLPPLALPSPSAATAPLVVPPPRKGNVRSSNLMEKLRNTAYKVDGVAAAAAVSSDAPSIMSPRSMAGSAPSTMSRPSPLMAKLALGMSNPSDAKASLLSPREAVLSPRAMGPLSPKISTSIAAAAVATSSDGPVAEPLAANSMTGDANTASDVSKDPPKSDEPAAGVAPLSAVAKHAQSLAAASARLQKHLNVSAHSRVLSGDGAATMAARQHTATLRQQIATIAQATREEDDTFGSGSTAVPIKDMSVHLSQLTAVRMEKVTHHKSASYDVKSGYGCTHPSRTHLM